MCMVYLVSMNYKILIIGHGEFPKGIQSALEMIVGRSDQVFKIMLSHDGHDIFRDSVKKFLKKNDSVIVFADLTGGAPHQIVAKDILEQKYKNHIVVSGAPLSFLVQLAIDLPKTKKEAIDKINININLSKEFIKVIKN